MSRNKLFYPCLLVLLWAIMIYIINPIGNFPLNDDWQYARPVQYLVNRGYYASTNTYSPIIMAQVCWGALFCLPGGFSFNALRCSTEALSLISTLVFYFLLLKVSKNRRFSFLGAMLLVANPLYALSSGTFMTDVPFFTFTLLAIYFFYCYAESDKIKYIIVATLFSMVAVLIRQFGVILPIAFGISSIIKNRAKPIQWIKYFLPAIITGLALFGGLFWLKYIGSELQPYGGHSLEEFLNAPLGMGGHLLKIFSFSLVYSGFFLLPVLVFTTGKSFLSMTIRQKTGTIIAVLLLVPLLITWCPKVPSGNVLNTFGIGPTPLKDMEYSNFVNPDFPPLVLIILQTLGGIGAIMLFINFIKIVISIVQEYKRKEYSNPSHMAVFMFLFSAGYAVLLFVPSFFFDRYLLPFIPASAIIISSGVSEQYRFNVPVYRVCCLLTVCMAIFSSAIVHDYFAWNRSRWQATDYLTKDVKISPHKIDGGYEYNGWIVGRYYPEARGKSWWYVDDDEYIITFHKLDGYTIMKQFTYRNYIPYQIKNIDILHRK